VKGIPPGRWPPGEETTSTQTTAFAESKLLELQRFRERKLIDESVAVEYQRKVLKTLWLGELTREQESTNE